MPARLRAPTDTVDNPRARVARRYRFAMGRRRAVWAFAAVLLLGGCAPSPPPPSPEPSVVFMTDDEAFAAAEATYRAYVDALNQVDLSNPETFEAVYAWTTGEANAGERRSLSKMHADGLAMTGRINVDTVRKSSTAASALDTCLDVSDVQVVTASGQSAVSTERPGLQPSTVFLSPGNSSTGLLISAIDGGLHTC